MSDQGQGWGSYPPGSQGPQGAPGPAPPPPNYPYGSGYAPPQTEGTAIAALILAICSFFTVPVIPAIVALVLASSSKRKITASGGRLTGGTLNTVAVILAWVNIALWALLIIGLIVLVAVGTSSSNTLAALTG